MSAATEGSSTSKPLQGWLTNFTEARAEAKRLDKPLLIHFHADWCGPCRRMEQEFLGTPALLRRFGTSFVAVKVNSDLHPELAARFDVDALPGDVILAPDGRVLARTAGYQNREAYLAQLSRVEDRFEQLQQAKRAKDEGTKQKAKLAKDEKTNEKREAKDEADVPAVTVERNHPKMQPASRQVRSPQSDPSDSPSDPETVGLNGYSPVTLRQRRDWQKGRNEFSAQHKGTVYLMATAEELEAFNADPARYVPRLQGCDPVVLWETDRAIPGSTRFGAYFDNKLYLFVSSATRDLFKQDPHPYTKTRHVLRNP